MAKPIIMPKFGMDQTESTIVEWLVEEGAEVEKGDPLVVVETDKVNMEVEAPESGTLAGIGARAGDTVPVTSTIAYILAPGEALPEDAPQERSPVQQDAPQRQEKAVSSREQGEPRRATPVADRLAQSRGVDLSQLSGGTSGGRITKREVEQYLASQGKEERLRATPAARRVAREHEISLEGIQGSGPRNRIQEADVLAAVAQMTDEVEALELATSQVVEEGVEVVRLTGVRRTIARRMQQSVQTIPTFTLTTDLNAAPLLSWRDEMNLWLRQRQQAEVSVTALLLKIVAWTLRQHPWLNAHCYDDEVHLYQAVHLGVAVAREQGLIVPVIRDAHQKGVVELGNELKELGQRARKEQLTPQEVQGATFTVSNLGMFAVDHFTAIINPPEVAILAVGRVTERMVPVDGQATVQPMMSVTLTADHRVVDGALGARFMGDLEKAFAMPSLLLV